MTTAEVKRHQKKLAKKLYEYHYKSLGFSLNLKDFRICNDFLKIPFSPSAVYSGFFYRYEPEYRVFIEEIALDLDEVLGYNKGIRFLIHGSFNMNYLLANYYGVKDFDSVRANEYGRKVKVKHEISSKEELYWVEKYHSDYFYKVGKKFVENFKDKESIFNFYLDIYHKYCYEIERNNSNALFPRPAALTTLLYLGFKYGYCDYEKLIEIIDNAKKYMPPKLYEWGDVDKIIDYIRKNKDLII